MQEVKVRIPGRPSVSPSRLGGRTTRGSPFAKMGGRRGAEERNAPAGSLSPLRTHARRAGATATGKRQAVRRASSPAGDGALLSALRAIHICAKYEYCGKFFKEIRYRAMNNAKEDIRFLLLITKCVCKSHHTRPGERVLRPARRAATAAARQPTEQRGERSAITPSL